MRRRDVMLGAAAAAVGAVVGGGEVARAERCRRVGTCRWRILRGDDREIFVAVRDAYMAAGAPRCGPLVEAMSVVTDEHRWDGSRWVPGYPASVRRAFVRTWRETKRSIGTPYSVTMAAMVDLHTKFDVAWEDMPEAMAALCVTPRWEPVHA